jgi:hypothetical protein
MTVSRNNKAQDLCTELFKEVEGALSEAWISDDAYTDDPKEYLQWVDNAVLSLEDARKIMKRFLRRHGYRRARQ